MKHFFLLTLILFSLNSYSQNCNIGNESTNNNFTTAGISGNTIFGVKYTLSQLGTLNSINLIGNGTGEGVQMAVYDDNGGIPNNLIATSSQGTVDNGVITLPVNPVLLPVGDYWVMAVYETGGTCSDVNLNATGNVIYYKSLNYGDAIPTNASGFNSNTGQDYLYFLGINCGNTLSIENFNLVDKTSIYPNPTSDYIFISNLDNTMNYIIVNQLGQQIKKGIYNNRIDVSNLTNGIYFLNFENGSVLKFIKE